MGLICEVPDDDENSEILRNKDNFYENDTAAPLPVQGRRAPEPLP